MRIGILGGGAAGFFAAIHCKIFNPACDVVILEKSQKVLSKVKISGGGRCNVTNVESDTLKLSRHYPRGERQLAKAFREFSTTDTIKFFEDRGVPLVVQEDGCIFPKSQDSQSIIDCFLNECKKLNIAIKLGFKMENMRQLDGKWHLKSQSEELIFDRVIICIGGLPAFPQMQWLQDLGQPMISPCPSLFTFNMPEESIKEFMGIVAPNALVRIPGQKIQGYGPLLITHWGMSGPAILMLSAKGARILADTNYAFECHVSWLGIIREDDVRRLLINAKQKNGQRKLVSASFEEISKRLWAYLVEKSLGTVEKTWDSLSDKELNKLVITLTQDTYKVSGKTTFKEEFVTAGGVDLKHINFKTMESKLLPGIYFAGEILDIDGLTGGFNFQAAWTTAWLAARGASSVSIANPNA